MFTLGHFIEVARVESEKYKKLLEAHPPGTINNERNAARDRADYAQACINHIISQGLDSAYHIGPYHAFTPEKGQRVRVRKGALVFSTLPGYPEDGKVLSRGRQITVHAFDQGYIVDRTEVRSGRVTWAGSGGYWCWTDINNIDLIPI